MAEVTYNVAKLYLAKGDLDFDTADLRVLLLATATGADDPDLATVAAILATSAAECTDGSYARVELGATTITQDDANDRADVAVGNADFGSLDNETVNAAVVYLHVGADSSNIPVLYSDTNFPAVANGAGFVIDLSADLARIS